MSLYEFGPFALDADQLLLLHDGSPVGLGPKVVETLLALLEHPGEVLAKSALLDRIWPEGFVEEANLAQNIYVLRKMLKAEWRADAIETVPRRGYRFVAPVRLAERIAAVPAAVAAAASPIRRWTPARVAMAAIAAVAVAVFTGGMVVASSFAHRTSSAPELSDAGARMYAIGRYYWNLRTESGVEKSLVYFAKVVGNDPRDPRGYAGLAEANVTMADYHYGQLGSKTYLARGRAYAQKALRIDPQSSEAFAALGFIALENHSIGEAIGDLKRAIAYDGTNGPAHEWYGFALMERGQVPEAFNELQTAANLDPLSVATTALLGELAYLDRRYDAAIAYSRQTLDLEPGRADVYSVIGVSDEALGHYDAAIESFKKLSDRCSYCRADAAALLAHAYARAHRMDAARTELEYAEAHARNVDPGDLAIALLAVGERQDGFSWLRRVHGMGWAAVANDARFDAIRSDAGFKQLQQGPA